MNSSKLAFGLRLRAHRERRGISHDALAESLKIKRSLLNGLERGDLSHWPDGIYRRALFREYVKAVGLSPAETFEEFCELFPERDTSATPAPAGRQSSFRLTLADSPFPTRSVVAKRAANAAADLGMVLAIGYAAALVSGSAYWVTSGIVALVWYPALTIFGGDPLRRLVATARARRTSAGAGFSSDVVISPASSAPTDR